VPVAPTKEARMKRSPKPGDASQVAWAVVAEATGQAQPDRNRAKNPAAVARGRAGGLARARNLTQKQRLESARSARAARSARRSPFENPKGREISPQTAAWLATRSERPRTAAFVNAEPLHIKE
jgi:hypothetical protein